MIGTKINHKIWGLGSVVEKVKTINGYLCLVLFEKSDEESIRQFRNSQQSRAKIREAVSWIKKNSPEMLDGFLRDVKKERNRPMLKAGNGYAAEQHLHCGQDSMFFPDYVTPEGAERKHYSYDQQIIQKMKIPVIAGRKR